MTKSEASTSEQHQQSEPMPLRTCAGEVVRQIRGDNALGTAAEIGFFLSLAIPPLLVSVFLLSSMLNEVAGIPIVDTLEGVIEERAPDETHELFTSVIENTLQQAASGAASFGVISALAISIWSISNAIGALIRATNHAFEIQETRGWFQRRALALALASLVLVSILIAITLFFFGNILGTFLSDRYGLGTAFDILWMIGRWPLLIAVIIGLLAILYYYGPNTKQSFRWTSPGSLIATGLWLIGAFGFWIYIQVWDPSSLYGISGFLLVLLTFMYMTGFVFLIGAEINSVLAYRYDPAARHNNRRKPEVFHEWKAEQEDSSQS